ncbi:Lix1-Like Protein [Manis pentadactyla]|nr:Lix1-Like Protein [Manis pentadactyla]
MEKGLKIIDSRVEGLPTVPGSAGPVLLLRRELGSGTVQDISALQERWGEHGFEDSLLRISKNNRKLMNVCLEYTTWCILYKIKHTQKNGLPNFLF